jgi:hypothetical protein
MRVVAHWFATLSYGLRHRGRDPWSLPHIRPRSVVLYRYGAIHSRACVLLQGHHEKPPSRSRKTGAASRGVSFPTAIASSKGPLFPRVPILGTLRLQGSSPLDAFLPIEPSTHLWAGRSWDSTFRALLLPRHRDLFRSPEPSWRYPSDDLHASSALHRTRPSSRFMRPREGSSRPPSGPRPPRESVPDAKPV